MISILVDRVKLPANLLIEFKKKKKKRKKKKKEKRKEK